MISPARYVVEASPSMLSLTPSENMVLAYAVMPRIIGIHTRVSVSTEVESSWSR